MKPAKGLVVIVAIAALVGLLAENAFAGVVVIVKCVESNAAAVATAPTAPTAASQPTVFVTQASSPAFVFPASCATPTATSPGGVCAQCLHDLNCAEPSQFFFGVETTADPNINVEKFVFKCGQGNQGNQ